jgi:hypothetical protein
MDILEFKKLKRDIKYKASRKLFFNRYLYKLRVMVPGSGSLKYINNESDFDNFERKYDYHTGRRHPLIIDRRQLKYYHRIRKDNSETMEFRCESPTLSIYGNNLDDLLAIAKQDKKNLLEIHGPNNDEELELISQGNIIVRRIEGYTKKVMIREGAVTDPELALRILDYLRDLEPHTVKLTRSLVRNLTHDRYWFSGGYFYTNDPGITTFIELMSPGLIQNIFDVKTVAAK